MGRIALLQLAQDPLLRGVGVKPGHPANPAVRFGHIDDAPVGERWRDEASQAQERSRIVERLGEQRARVGQEAHGLLRARALPQAGAQEASVGLEAAASTEPMKEETPRVDWAELLSRTFDVDVFACMRCGGRRRVLAYVKGAEGVRAILEHLGLGQALEYVRVGSIGARLGELIEEA